jgi:hypothetical protein
MVLAKLNALLASTQRDYLICLVPDAREPDILIVRIVVLRETENGESRYNSNE